MGTLLRVLTVGTLAGDLSSRSLVALGVNKGPAYFEPFTRLCLSGEVRTSIDSTYPLAEPGAALTRVGEGRALGKIVVVPA